MCIRCVSVTVINLIDAQIVPFLASRRSRLLSPFDIILVVCDVKSESREDIPGSSWQISCQDLGSLISLRSPGCLLLANGTERS